jgi:hypothetical protein
VARKKTSAQLDREIASSLAAPRQVTPTDTNIFALSELVLKAGGQSTISNRLERVDYPHIRRCLAGGLLTVSSPTTLTLTPAGRKAVLQQLRQTYSSQSAAFTRVPERFDAKDRARLDQLRNAIAQLESS